MSQPIKQTISARFVAPVCIPPIADGIVSFAAGRITYVGSADGRKIDQRFDDAILLPGLVNAHTHLDLTGAKDKTPPQADFCQWLRAVIAFRRTRTAEQVRADVADGVRQCVESGTTLVGDIAQTDYDYGPCSVVAFQELIGLSEERSRAAINAGLRANNSFAGLSPHAPYSFRFSQLLELPGDVPLAMHLAESRAELELLAIHAGPMRQFLVSLGAWDESGLAPSLEAVLEGLSQREAPTLLVHCNYLSANAHIPANATIVYCPRTHSAFGHDRHPFREFLALGHRVALGTDSLASNPDLSVLHEARFLFEQFSDAEALLRMVTLAGAEALGMGEIVGMLAPGYCADLCVIGLPPRTQRPLPALFGGNDPVKAVFISGKRLV